MSKYLTKAEREGRTVEAWGCIDVSKLLGHADMAEALLLEAAEALTEASMWRSELSRDEAGALAAKIRAAVGAKEEE